MWPILIALILTIISFKPATQPSLNLPTAEKNPPVSTSFPTQPPPSPASTHPPASHQNQTAPNSAKPKEAWGQLIKTGDLTYTIKVADDPVMTTPAEALQALNDLRRRYGAQPLKTDPRLCEYAQQRAEFFNSIGGIDAHKGFEKFLREENGFQKLGFQRLGENSSYGYKLSGVHLIEFVYMQSPTHNQNQLNPDWDRGCVGVSGTATNFIFATSPF